MEPIKTYLRLRPSSELATHESQSQGYVEIENETEILMTPPPNSRAKKSSKHKFTKVFGQATAQSDIFEETCLPLLAPVMRQENYNALLFAYGVSNSGKTHTVLGSSQPGQAGILPRALAVVFRSIDTFIQDSGEAAQYRPIGFQDVERIDTAGTDVMQDEQQHEYQQKQSVDSIKSLDGDLMKFAERLDIQLDDVSVECLLGEGNTEIDSHVVSLPDGMDYTVWVSCAEIYTEKIHDLLAEPPESLVPGLGALSPKRPALHMQTDQTTGQKYIHGLRDIKVRTLEEALLVLRAGLRQRQVFSTLLNNVSSRSHCVFTIKILKTPQFGNSAAETAAKGKTSVSRLSIVDLAGSERVRNTNSTGQRRREAGNINNSLMVLGHCMEVLRLNQIGASKVPQMVPYRHSKLTQLFQGVLDGKSKNSKMCLIINVNPFQNEFDETIQSLRFSSVAMNVSTLRQRGSKDESSPIRRTPSTPTQKKQSSATARSPLVSGQSSRSQDDVDGNLESSILISTLQHQVEDLYEKLAAAEGRCSAIEGQAREQFMDQLTSKLLVAFSKKETCTRSASPPALAMETVIEKSRSRRSSSPPVLEPVDVISNKSDNQNKRAPVPTENIRQIMEECETKNQAKEEELQLLGSALAESEEKRAALERALEDANHTIKAWQQWLNDAPSMHRRSNIRVPSSHSEGTPAAFLVKPTAQRYETTENHISSVMDQESRYARRTNSSTTVTEIARAATVGLGMMETIQDAEKYAVEQAAQDEAFVDYAAQEETILDEDSQDDNFVEEAVQGQNGLAVEEAAQSLNGLILEEGAQDKAFVKNAAENEEFIEKALRDELAIENMAQVGRLIKDVKLQRNEVDDSDQHQDRAEQEVRQDDDTHDKCVIESAKLPVDSYQNHGISRETTEDAIEAVKDINEANDDVDAVTTMQEDYNGSSTDIMTALRSDRFDPGTMITSLHRRSFPAMMVSIPSNTGPRRFSMMEMRSDALMSSRFAALRGLHNQGSMQSIKKARLSLTEASPTLLEDSDSEYSPVNWSDPQMIMSVEESHDDTFQPDDGDETDDSEAETVQDHLLMTPEKESRRDSSGNRYVIDDHVNTPLADISPIRSLYPRLSPLSPRDGHQEEVDQPQPSDNEHATKAQDSPFVTNGEDEPIKRHLFSRWEWHVEEDGREDGDADKTVSLDPADISLEDRSDYGSAIQSLEHQLDMATIDHSSSQEMDPQENSTQMPEENATSNLNDGLATPSKKRRRKLRAKNAIMVEEMEETIGMPPPAPLTRRKKGSGRR
ncbi:hypothetical protein BGZ54_008733 [Gamsiella multidivaricata]|nr:hypothetical protein BGZ54_008733 [Gamsiella multidivaricata]